MGKILKENLLGCEYIGTLKNNYPQTSSRFTKLSLYYSPTDGCYFLHTVAGYKSPRAEKVESSLGGVFLKARDDVEVISKKTAQEYIDKYFRK